MNENNWDQRSYLGRLGDSVSQFFNVLLFNGMPDESISGRSWRNRDKKRWRFMMTLANALYFRQKDHCRFAYEYDITRAKARYEASLNKQ